MDKKEILGTIEASIITINDLMLANRALEDRANKLEGVADLLIKHLDESDKFVDQLIGIIHQARRIIMDDSDGKSNYLNQIAWIEKSDNLLSKFSKTKDNISA